MNAQFTWYDSYTREKKTSSTPMMEMVSSLYNYAVCLTRIACFMPLAGDGIKRASKNFCEAAWVFEHLLTMTS